MPSTIQMSPSILYLDLIGSSPTLRYDRGRTTLFIQRRPRKDGTRIYNSEIPPSLTFL